MIKNKTFPVKLIAGLLNAMAFHGASACWLSHMKQ